MNKYIITALYIFSSLDCAEKSHDLAIESFNFNCFEDKQQTLKLIFNRLKPNGEYFFNVHTREDPKPLNFIIGKKIILSPMGSLLKSATEFFSTNPSGAVGCSCPTREELKAMINIAGFDIITCKQQSCKIILKDRKEVEDYQRPIVMSRPIIQYIPEMLRTYLFAQFIDHMIQEMKQTENKEYIEELITTIVHIRKK